MEKAESVKNHLRSEVLALRGKLTTPQRVIQSAKVLQRVFDLGLMEQAKWIHFYCSAGSEVETSGMMAHALRSGKRVSVPRMDTGMNRLVLSEVRDPAKELSQNGVEIPEPLEEFYRPVEEGLMDLFIIPGVAFDENGGRLGKGKGYYDRLLAPIISRNPVVGLAFESQIVPEVPMEEHDIRVDWIVTEKRVIRCRN